MRFYLYLCPNDCNYNPALRRRSRLRSNRCHNCGAEQREFALNVSANRLRKTELTATGAGA